MNSGEKTDMGRHHHEYARKLRAHRFAQCLGAWICIARWKLLVQMLPQRNESKCGAYLVVGYIYSGDPRRRRFGTKRSTSLPGVNVRQTDVWRGRLRNTKQMEALVADGLLSISN